MGGILGFQTFAVCAVSASVMLGKEIVIGCVVYACLAFRFVELVLLKVGGIVFLKVPFEEIQCISRPVLTVTLFEVLLVNVLLDIGFIGAYFLGYADSDCFIIQQFTDRRIEFVQFQSGIDIFLASSETSRQRINIIPSLFKQPLEGSRFFGGAYLLTLQVLA